MTPHFTRLPDSIPALEELKQRPQWVAWKYETRKGRLTKPPINPHTSGYASVSDPTNWAPYEQAAAFASKEGLAGVGFVLTEDDGYTGIDLDKCIAPDGTIAEWAQFILDGYAETYAEVSPSGQGLRLIARGKPDKALKYDPAGVEVYGGGRYLTITGNRVPYTPDDIRAAPMTLAALAERVNSVRGESRPEAAAPEANPLVLRTDFVGRTNQLALANLSAWVLELFPSAQRHASTGGYRVSSADLGRELEEDLSITPQGIVDFGLHDMGDPREGKRTAVEIVMEHCCLDEKSAAFWLCEKLEMSPTDVGYFTASDEFGEIDIDVGAGASGGEDGAGRGAITAKPYALVDPTTIPKREWLYARHLMRKFVSVTVAPGGIGKSSLAIVEALAMVSGKPLLGFATEPLRVWYWNLEDPYDELQRRIQAAVQHYGLTADDIGDRLFVNSGRDDTLRLAVADRNGARIVRPVADGFTAEMIGRRIDAAIVDPFVSSHGVPENDNNGMDLVAKEWGRVADKANAAISLVHHTRKMGSDEVTSDSARGGKALVDASRDARVLNRMSKEDGEKAGVDNHRLYFRSYSDKASMAPPADRSDWFKLENVALANGDDVGVVVAWEWPDPFAEITHDHVRRVQDAVRADIYRADVRSTEWVGFKVAEIVGLNPEATADKERLKTMIREWTEKGWLKVRKVRDEKGKDRPVVEAGTALQEENLEP